MSAAKWHREQAYSFAAAAKHHGYGPDHSFSVAARNHALAADVLEALTVPGVAELLYGLSGDRGYQPTDEQRAALLRLHDAARSGR